MPVLTLTKPIAPMSRTRAANQDLAALLEGCRREDRLAQEALYRQFLPLVFGTCLRYAGKRDTALDLSNQAFLKIFRSLTELREHQAFPAWAKRIAIHTALDHLRRESARTRWNTLEAVPEPYADAEVLDRFDTEELLQHLQGLPPMSRAVFLLSAVEGYGHAEIAQSLGMSEGTSRWHLSAARSALKRQLSESPKRPS